MENEMLSTSMNMPSQSPVFIDDVSMLAGVHCEPISHIDADFHFINHASTADPSSLVTLQLRDFTGNASLRTSSATYTNDFQRQEQLSGATVTTPASLAARFGLSENSEKSATLSPSLESLLPYLLSNQHNISNSSFATFEELGHSELLGNSKGSNVNNFSKSREPEGTPGFPASCGSRKLSRNYSAAVIETEGNILSMDSLPNRRMVVMDHNASSMESTLQRQSAESKKTQLRKLLQLRLDKIHTVVSAFHAATELETHTHAHFALQIISLLYNDLRERMGYYIVAMGENSNSTWAEEKETSVEASFIKKLWAFQQLKGKDDQLWRPQRGLPERSVSVLRAWMFQNFLHPYSKDAEKHILAGRSGLTRSQVSNWFINARVRLWKPMIEEMYAQLNNRNYCPSEGGIESSLRSMFS